MNSPRPNNKSKDETKDSGRRRLSPRASAYIAFSAVLVALAILPAALSGHATGGEGCGGDADELAELSSAVTTEAGTCTVNMTSYGAWKLNVIKAVKSITGLGLKESKDLVDALPSDILSGVSLESAESAETTLEAAGATIELNCTDSGA